jgi:hypothetical protein
MQVFEMKNTVTLPKTFHPDFKNAQGVPVRGAPEHPVMLSSKEMQLVKALTDGKANRTKFGALSFEDTSEESDGGGSAYQNYQSGYGNYGNYGAAQVSVAPQQDSFGFGQSSSNPSYMSADSVPPIPRANDSEAAQALDGGYGQYPSMQSYGSTQQSSMMAPQQDAPSQNGAFSPMPSINMSDSFAAGDPYQDPYSPQAAHASLIDASNRLGVKPSDLATAQMYETRGTMNPNLPGGIRNDGTGKNSFKGLIQASTDMQNKYGYYPGISTPEYNANITVPYMQQDAKLQPGADFAHVYSGINTGKASIIDTNPNRSDWNGTIAQNIARAQNDYGQRGANYANTAQTSEMAYNPSAYPAPNPDVQVASSQAPQAQQPFQIAGGMPAPAADTPMQPASNQVQGDMYGQGSIGAIDPTGKKIADALLSPSTQRTLGGFMFQPGSPETDATMASLTAGTSSSGNGTDNTGKSLNPTTPPQANPAQIQSLLAELKTTTDPVRRSQINSLLAQLDPNTIRYNVSMGA